MVSLDEIITSDMASMELENDDLESVIEIKIEPRDDDYEDIRSIHNSSVSSDPEKNKTYYCQRCLNHGLKFQRKGHKPECRYATCTCTLCLMVEQRRQINYELSIRKAELGEDETSSGGKRIRSPKCARCSAHGKKQALRGHKKVLCPFNKCTCDLCGLVESRRNLMARQIRIRRNQRKHQDKSDSNESFSHDLPPLPKLNPSLISKPPLAKPTPIHINHSSLLAKIQNQNSNSNDLLRHSRESSAFKEPNNNVEANPVTTLDQDSVNSMLFKHIQT
uniref:DM domain-containing protein n=1 Tax=Panagrolaimus sp. JU765 TaxID=591449 RepID=A0AC34QMH8_9BILA